jgi:hypothetical protein
MTQLSKSAWMENAKRAFAKMKDLSSKYNTWNDIQKSDEEFKSATWKMIKNFRKSPDNDKAYKFRILDGKKYCFGWSTLTQQFTPLF